MWHRGTSFCKEERVLYNCLPWDQDARRPRRCLSPLSEKQQLPQKQGAASTQRSWFKAPLEQMVNSLFPLSRLKNDDPWSSSPCFCLPAHPLTPPLVSFKGETCGSGPTYLSSSSGSCHPMTDVLPTLGYVSVGG